MENEKRPNPFYAALVVVSPDRQKILLAKRKEDGIWTGPGGGAEQGENPKQAAIREAFEEANLRLDPNSLEELPVGYAKDGRPVFRFLCVLNEMQETSPHNDPDKEVRKWDWYPLDAALPEPMGEGRRETVLAAKMRLAGLQKAETLEKGKPAMPVGSVSPDGHYVKTAQGWKHRESGKKPHSVTMHVEHEGKMYEKQVHGVMGHGHQEVMNRMASVIKRLNKQHPNMKVHKLSIKDHEFEKSFSADDVGQAYAAQMDAYGDALEADDAADRARWEVLDAKLRGIMATQGIDRGAALAVVEAEREQSEESKLLDLVRTIVAFAPVPVVEPMEKGFDGLAEALEKARPALPIGTIRVWGGQKYVKHAEGWVAVSGKHHGKRMGSFGADATHKEFADQHVDPRPQAEEETSDASPKDESKPQPEAPKADHEAERKAKIEANEKRIVELEAKLKEHADSQKKEAEAKEKAQAEEKAKKDSEAQAAKQEKEKKAAEKEAAKADTPPEDSPRAEADREQAEQDEDYAFARKSDFGNKGEDLKGSARHKRNEWKGLEAAEKDGTAEALVKRDTLMKEAPVDFSNAITPKGYMGTLAAYMALKKFPPAPKSTTLSYYDGKGDDTVVRIEVKRADGGTELVHPQRFAYLSPEQQASAKQITKGEIGKILRKEYVDAFNRMRNKAESLMGESDPAKVIAEMKKEVAQIIDDSRKTNKYSDLANMLVTYHNNGLSAYSHKSSSVTAELKDFSRRLAGQSMEGKEGVDTQGAEFARKMVEGAGIDKAFGQTKGRGFTAADAYVAHAERVGPEDPQLENKAGQEKAILDDMGMRGLQWGNSVTDDERKHHLKQIAMAFKDLSEILGLPEELCSFNGRLGLAVGARGKGTALAHYEPGTRVINLTRKGGVGSLAHEWSHGLDNILCEVHGISKTGFLSNHAQVPGRAADSPVISAMSELVSSDAMREFRSRIRSTESYRRMSEGKREYWTSTLEMFARTFECYVQGKLSSKGRKNTYLSGVVEKGASSFWPTDEETEKLTPLFDRFFETFRKSEYLKKALDYLELASGLDDLSETVL